MMKRPLSEELQELFEQLEAEGWNPRLCDTPVIYCDLNMPADEPSMLGSYSDGEYMVLPRDLVGLKPSFTINLKSNAMCDAGLDEGDQLQVQTGAEVRDGDIVLARVEGEYLVRAYCEDEQGNRWLVSCNEAYQPICLEKGVDVHFVGRVMECTKQGLRCSHSEMMKSIKRVN